MSIEAAKAVAEQHSKDLGIPLRATRSEQSGSVGRITPFDKAADALRRFEQGGKQLRLWGDLPSATKNKWRLKAKVVLDAAAAPDMLESLPGLCEADRDDLNDSTSAVWQEAVAAIRKATEPTTGTPR